nr:AMP-binding protein [Shewanella corallii]
MNHSYQYPERNSLATPWPFNTIAQAAKLRAEQTPDAVAHYFEDGTCISFGQTWVDSMALAQSFKAMGLKKGDVVSFQLPNWYEAVIINLAASCLGLVVNPIVPIYRGHELKYMLNKAKARVLFVPETFRGFNYRHMLEQLRPDVPCLEKVIIVRPSSPGNDDYDSQLIYGKDLEPVEADMDEIKLLLFTSGTTGSPKGVLHSHRSLAWAIQNCCDFWSMTDGDKMFMPSPVTHITGYTFGLEVPYFNRTPSALMETWEVTAAARWIDEIGATVCVGATPFLQELTEHQSQSDTELSSLRLFACGGAVVPPKVIFDATRILPNCQAIRVYGSSETPIVTLGFLLPGQENLAANTDGHVFRYQVRIVNQGGHDAPFNEEGEVCARGPAMMCGYLDPDDNLDAFDDKGFFKTGDLGYLTKESALVISGRKKDLIIRGGENISAREIEDVLAGLGEVREVACVAIPHLRLGETVCAFLVSGGADVTLNDIRQQCADAGLAKQKWPQHIVLVDALPKTPSGKVQKYQLREQVSGLVVDSQQLMG